MPRYSRRFAKRRRYGSRSRRGRRSWGGRKRFSSRFASRKRRTFSSRRKRTFGGRRSFRRKFVKRGRKYPYAASGETFPAVQGPVPFPLAFSADDGVISFTTVVDTSTGGLTLQQVQYGSIPFRTPGLIPTAPTVFGTVNPATSVMGYEFLYLPNLDVSPEFFGTNINGVSYRLESMFNFYREFRVAKVRVTFERTGRPPLRVQDVGLAGAAVTQNVGTAGAEAYFAVSRFGNSYHSVRPADGALNWSPEEMSVSHAFYQMQNDYPRQRKRMLHVKDMSRAKRFSFAFVPTVTSPLWVTGFVDGDLVDNTAINRYRPVAGYGGEYQPQRFKRFPWMPTAWKTGGSGLAENTVRRWGMYGLCGALRPGSWRPGDWVSWGMKVNMTLQFRGRHQDSNTAFGDTRPAYPGLNAYLQNYSYNLRNP